MGPVNALMKEAKRLFHGRGQGLNYNIDSIPPYLLIDSFEDLAEDKLQSIMQELPPSKGIFYRNRKKREPFRALTGSVPDTHFLIENGLRFEINLKDNQNIGFFMDMKPGRELISKLSNGKKVLNLFSYTCSFSVAAMKAGALKVTNIDMKKSFLKAGQKNHQLNSLEKNVQFLSYDIMKSLSGISKKGPWDLIIIDPPSHQKSFHLESAYPKLLKKVDSWLSPNGVVLACLNSPFLDSGFLLEHAPAWEVSKVLYSAEEFKEEDPEKGLKMVLFTRAES
jgi:23S rRNA (cytosine1962-C5)-methyltransferase